MKLAVGDRCRIILQAPFRGQPARLGPTLWEVIQIWVDGKVEIKEADTEYASQAYYASLLQKVNE